MKTVAIVSGGMDSAVLLYHLRQTGNAVLALSVFYGQRHRVELDHAAALCAELDVPHRVADLSCLRELLPGSSQTDDRVPVPRGHYTNDSMRRTVVPNRNMIMLSVAAGYALANGCDALAYGAHAGDHAIYPDCRPAFVDAVQVALSLCDWNQLALLAPFLNVSKTEIARQGHQLGVPFERTWTCYDPQLSDRKEQFHPGDLLTSAPAAGDEWLHCGMCGACTERREALGSLPDGDPTWYAPPPFVGSAP